MDGSMYQKKPKLVSYQPNEQIPWLQGSLRAIPDSQTKVAIQCAKRDIERSNQHGEIFESDRVTLQNIFPEELWIMIFGYLTLSTDLSNVSKSAGYLKKLILKRRTEYLFSKAFSVFEKYLVRINYWNQKILEEHFKCRLVCKTWCEGVDNMLPSRLGLETFDRAEYRSFSFQHQGIEQKIYKFIQHFKGTHENTNRNPFLSRSMELSIEFRVERGLEGMYARVQELLNKYGQHIWKLDLHFHEVKFAPAEFSVYQLTKRILEKMSNLKTLRLRTPRYDSEYFSLDRLVVKDFENVQEDVPQYGILPPLPNLETLEIHDVHATFLKHIIETSNKLCTLDTGFGCFNSQSKFYEISGASLSYLTELRLRVSTATQWEVLVQPEHKWKLKTLAIDFEKKLCIPWNLVFQCITWSFGNSLKNLKIMLPRPVDIYMKQENLEWSLVGRLCLPILQQLEIKCMSSTIDFLLPLGKTLQRLLVNTKTDVGDFDLEILSIPNAQQTLEKQIIPAVGSIKTMSTEKQKFQNFFPKVSDLGSLDRLFESKPVFRF